MSRIDKSSCECMDMEWYGVDKVGNIGVFCSAGVGNLPEFVCENEERSYKIIEWFEHLKPSTSSIIYHEMPEKGREVAEEFSDKGLFYFDSDDWTKFNVSNLKKYYTKASSPKKALKYELLPNEIKNILSFNFLNIDNFENVETVSVPHAYDM